MAKIIMKGNKKELVLGLVIGLILGLIIGYLLAGKLNKNNSNFRGSNFQNFQNNSFQIDNQTKNEIVAFFGSTNDAAEISSYCQKNMIYCAYYCREINSNNSICGQIPPMRRR